jgi:hypothetical protein
VYTLLCAISLSALGIRQDPDVTPEELADRRADRRARLVAAWEAGPHPSQVLARRLPLMEAIMPLAKLRADLEAKAFVVFDYYRRRRSLPPSLLSGAELMEKYCENLTPPICSCYYVALTNKDVIKCIAKYL